MEPMRFSVDRCKPAPQLIHFSRVFKYDPFSSSFSLSPSIQDSGRILSGFPAGVLRNLRPFIIFLSFFIYFFFFFSYLTSIHKSSVSFLKILWDCLSQQAPGRFPLAQLRTLRTSHQTRQMKCEMFRAHSLLLLLRLFMTN